MTIPLPPPPDNIWAFLPYEWFFDVSLAMLGLWWVRLTLVVIVGVGVLIALRDMVMDFFLSLFGVNVGPVRIGADGSVIVKTSLGQIAGAVKGLTGVVRDDND